MKEYNVCLPLTGEIWVTVEAESEEDAISAAMESDDLKTSNIDTWDVHRSIVRGNVFYGALNEAFAEEA